MYLHIESFRGMRWRVYEKEFRKRSVNGITPKLIVMRNAIYLDYPIILVI